MADNFDPYYTWMAIPPAEQPPDLYRLVGVSKFEENLDVISYAIDQRMTHIRTFQVGKHAQHSQRILNELSAARGTLLDPDRKAAYDKKVQAAAAPKPEPKPLPRAKPMAVPQEVAPAPARPAPAHAPAAVLKPVPAQSFSAAPVIAQPVHASASPAGIAPKLGIALAAGTGCLVLLIGLAIIFMFRGGDELPVAKGETVNNDPPPIVAPINDDPVQVVSNEQKKTNPSPVPPAPAPANTKVTPRPAAEDTETVRPTVAGTNNPSTVPAVSPAGNSSTQQKRHVLRLSSNRRIEVENSKDLATQGTEFTAEFWGRWTFDGNSDEIIFGNVPGEGAPAEDGPGSWQLIYTKNGSGWIQSANGVGGGGDNFPNDGRWHHVAVCSNGSMIYLFLDGKLRLGNGISGSAKGPRTTNLYLGSLKKLEDTTNFIDYSAFRLSSKCRYTDEFQPPRVLTSDSDVLALYDLTKFAGKIEDLSGKGHHGICHGVSFVETTDEVALASAAATSSVDPTTSASPVTTEPVDLLARVNMDRDVLQGVGRMNDGKLITGGTQRDFIAVNVPLPPEYVLQATVTRRTNLEGLGIGLVIGRTKTIFSIDAYPGFGNRTGLSVVDGQMLHRDQYPGAHKGTLLTNDRPAVIRLAVKPNSIKAFHNGRQIYQWEGDPQRLSVLKSSYTPTEAQVFLTSANSVYEISDFRLLPYDDKPASSSPSTDLATKPSGNDTPTSPPKSNLLTPPDDATAKKAREETRGILKEDFAAARRPEDKVPLAKKLAGLARSTKDDAVTQYILWEEAWHAALEGGNLVLAMSILEEEASKYEIDLPARQLEAVKQVVQLARTAADRKMLAETAFKIATDAAAVANFEIAEQAVRIAAASAAKAGDTKLKSEIATSAKQIDTLKKQAALANQAAERLKTDPENPKANLAYGRYLCGIKGDWQKGLQHLKKSGDATLAAIIEADEAQPSDNAARVALGDKYWTQAQTAPADDKSIYLARASFWYERSVGQLNGLTRERIAKRIKDIEGEVPAHMLKGGSALVSGSSGVAGGRTLDMLKSINPTRDTIKGNWRVENGVLLCTSQGLVPKIHLPYQPPEEYDVKVVFSQPTIRNDLCILAPKKGTTVAFVFGGEPGRMGVLTETPNQPPGAPPRTVKTVRNSFGPNRRYTAVLQVRNDGVVGFIDGVEVIRYATDYSDVRPDVWRSIPDRDRLAIGTDDPTMFHAVEVTEVTGAGKMLDQ